MIRRLVVATHNAKKAGEMTTVLSRRLPSLRLLTLNDFPGAPEPEETGTTYAENAVIKAEAASSFTREWCVADDAGLEVDALPGELGLWSKRFAGEGTSFDDKISILLDRLQGVPDDERGARFRCCVAVAGPGDEGTTVFEATCEGRIARARSGLGGFGYDPVFWLPGRRCTMADLTADEKHAVSHRGKVLAAVCDWLEGQLG